MDLECSDNVIRSQAQTSDMCAGRKPFHIQLGVVLDDGRREGSGGGRDLRERDGERLGALLCI